MERAQRGDIIDRNVFQSGKDVPETGTEAIEVSFKFGS